MAQTELVLHDPATYARGFPHEYFRELRRRDPVSHHPHPMWPRGDWAVSSANRDEDAFVDPDTIDVTRDPNDHVAFGAGGPHFCLGASRARLEARVMFESILTRFEGLEVTVPVDELPRVHSNLIDGYAHMPVRWSALRPRPQP